MTFEELKSLRGGEVVVITKVDEKITDYHEYVIGDELDFMNIFTMDKHGRDVVNFYRRGDSKGKGPVIAHFSYDICDYIERKVLLERESKLNNLGI